MISFLLDYPFSHPPNNITGEHMRHRVWEAIDDKVDKIKHTKWQRFCIHLKYRLCKKYRETLPTVFFDKWHKDDLFKP